MSDAVTWDELVERARAMIPPLRERAAEGDELRRLPDSVVADMAEAGFFRILQPRRWGGFEAPPQVLFDVQTTIARGYPSAAWVLGVVAVHGWQLALFDERAQKEVWGDDPDTRISSSYAPTGKVTPVDGGFRISGRWSFSSGCDHCQWAFLGGFVPTAEGEPPDMRTFLLPRGDYEIDDNWHVAGLVGTGSKDIVADDVFVPSWRTHRLMDGFKCKSPGNEVNPAPLYRLPFGQVFVRSVSTSAIGMAEGALEAYRDVAAKRIAASDQSKVALDPSTQMIAARAAAAIEECKLVLGKNFDEMMRLAVAAERIPVEDRVKWRFDSSLAVEKCVAAIDSLFTASGGRAIFLGHPLLRYFLDVHAARAHYANNPDKPGRNFGGVQLGLQTVDYFI